MLCVLCCVYVLCVCCVCVCVVSVVVWCCVRRVCLCVVLCLLCLLCFCVCYVCGVSGVVSGVVSYCMYVCDHMQERQGAVVLVEIRMHRCNCDSRLRNLFFLDRGRSAKLTYRAVGPT